VRKCSRHRQCVPLDGSSDSHAVLAYTTQQSKRKLSRIARHGFGKGFLIPPTKLKLVSPKRARTKLAVETGYWERNPIIAMVISTLNPLCKTPSKRRAFVRSFVFLSVVSNRGAHPMGERTAMLHRNLRGGKIRDVPINTRTMVSSLSGKSLKLLPPCFILRLKCTKFYSPASVRSSVRSSKKRTDRRTDRRTLSDGFWHCRSISSSVRKKYFICFSSFRNRDFKSFYYFCLHFKRRIANVYPQS